MQETTAKQLIDSYDFFLLDAFGVLVEGTGVLPHAQEFLDTIVAEGKDYCILTNGSAQNVKKTAANYLKKGLNVDVNKVITSGSLLNEYFSTHATVEKRAVIIGNENAAEIVRDAGCEVVDLASAFDKEVNTFIVMDQQVADLRVALDDFLSCLMKRIDHGADIHLILPNPDFIYPKGADAYGITSGSLAHLIEGCLLTRYGNLPCKFTKLGKPYAPIFATGIKRAKQGDKILMIGDQILTDIKGAVDAGIDSALILTGLTRAFGENTPYRPTWIIDSLALP